MPQNWALPRSFSANYSQLKQQCAPPTKQHHTPRILKSWYQRQSKETGGAYQTKWASFRGPDTPQPPSSTDGFGIKVTSSSQRHKLSETPADPHALPENPRSRHGWSWVQEAAVRLYSGIPQLVWDRLMQSRLPGRLPGLPRTSRHYSCSLSTKLTPPQAATPAPALIRQPPSYKLARREAAIKATLGAAAQPGQSRQSNDIRLLRHARRTLGCR